MLKPLFGNQSFKLWFPLLVIILLAWRMWPEPSGSVEVVLIEPGSAQSEIKTGKPPKGYWVSDSDLSFADGLGDWKKEKQEVWVSPPKVYMTQADGSRKLLKLNTPEECLWVNSFFESAGEPPQWQVFQQEVTALRADMFTHKGDVCASVKGGPMKNGKYPLNQCHYSWYCDGEPVKVIPGDLVSRSVAAELAANAKVVYHNYKAGLIDHNYTHYCTLAVEKKTSWVKTMKQSTRLVGGKHAFFEEDMVLKNKAWEKKLAMR